MLPLSLLPLLWLATAGAAVVEGTVVAVETGPPLRYDLPRTSVTIALEGGGTTTFVLPGANGGPPAAVAGLPVVSVGDRWRVDLVEAPVGRVPRGLAEGMVPLEVRQPVWNLNGNHLREGLLPLPFLVAEAGCPGLAEGRTEALVAEVLAQWSSVGCADFAFRYDGTTALGVADDGANVLAWETEQWDWHGGAAGMSITRFGEDEDGVYVREADILFNGVTFAWTEGPGNVYASPPLLDAASVALHEFGHVTGMDHEYDRVTSTMFYAYLGGDWMGTLAGDDRRGLCENYPSGEDECAADPDCTGIDGSPRTCVEIEGLKVCEEVRDPLGTDCSVTSYNCGGLEPNAPSACVITSAWTGEGYCSVPCPEGACPDGWTCGTADTTLPPGLEAVCVPAPDDTGAGPETGSPPADTGDPPEGAGCACGSAGAMPPLAALPPILLAVLRRRHRRHPPTSSRILLPPTRSAPP